VAAAILRLPLWHGVVKMILFEVVQTGTQDCGQGDAMAFLKKLFGFGGGGGGAAAPASDPVEYKGFLIRPAPYQDGGQYQTAGTISKEVGGTLREHRFVRADRFNAHEEAVAFALAKGRQLVDEQGERIFG
jgi:hypothetical protein